MINPWMVAAGMQEVKIKQRKPSVLKRYEPKRNYEKASDYWDKDRKRTSPKRDIVIQMFNKGWSVDRICEYFEITREYARCVLVDAGLVAKQKQFGRKKVLVYKTTGEFVGEYDYSVTAAKALGLSSSMVKKCLWRLKESAGGYVFKYKEDVEKNGE